MPGSKYNIDHLIIANHCGEGESSRCGRGPFGTCRHVSRGSAGPSTASCGRNLFYDLGCSVWGRSKIGATSHGTGLGSSLNLFYSMYEQNCITFDRIWGWEANAYEPKAWWRYMPAKIRAKLHFYNVPVEMDGESPGNRASVLEVLRETARPEDFVVVKVDIDESELEKKIVNAIATDPALSELVDELFFEYHYHFGTNRGPWGFTQQTNASDDQYTPDTVNDALNLMRRLRDVGIRSHFWV